MCVSQEILEHVEEFLDLITNEEDSSELETATDSLRRYLERDVDGWTGYSSGQLVDAVEERMEAIWKLISDFEKAENSLLGEYYDDVIEHLENVLRSEPDDDDEYYPDHSDDDECDDDSWD